MMVRPAGRRSDMGDSVLSHADGVGTSLQWIYNGRTGKEVPSNFDAKAQFMAGLDVRAKKPAT